MSRAIFRFLHRFGSYFATDVGILFAEKETIH